MLILHSYWTPQFQSFCHFSYMVITLYNLLKKFMLSLLLLSHPTVSKFCQPTNWNFFALRTPLNIFLEMGRNYVSTIITIISNITVSHRRLLQLSPPLLSLTRFSPGLFVVLQEILYQPSFALIRLLQKIMHF